MLKEFEDAISELKILKDDEYMKKLNTLKPSFIKLYSQFG